MFTAWMLLALPGANPLVVTPPAHHAGRAYVGQPLVHRVEIHNRGPSTAVITDIRASCGCAAPAIEKRNLLAGEKTTVTLDVNTLSQPAGPVRWSGTLEWQSGRETGRTTFELAADLVREIHVEPAALVLAGDIGLQHEIRVVDARPKPLAVTGVRTDRQYARVELLPDRRVLVRLAEACPPGVSTDLLRIATDDPKYPELRVPITIHRRVVARVTAVPAQAIIVPDASVLVQIRGQEGEAVQIERLEASAPALTTRCSPGPGTFATVRVSLDRSRWDGKPFTGEVRAILSSPQGETVRIPVQVRSEE